MKEMKNMKKHLYVLPVLGAITVGSIAGAIFTSTTISKASAATNISSTSTIQAPTNLSDSFTPPSATDQVAHEQQEVTDLTSQLSQAVTSGKLTQAQSDLALKIESEKDTLHSQEETSEGTTGETTEHANMKNLKSETQAQIQLQMSDEKNALVKALGITTTDLDSLTTALQNAGIHMIGGKGVFHN